MTDDVELIMNVLAPVNGSRLRSRTSAYRSRQMAISDDRIREVDLEDSNIHLRSIYSEVPALLGWSLRSVLLQYVCVISEPLFGCGLRSVAD